jgi:hypothetical protein
VKLYTALKLDRKQVAHHHPDVGTIGNPTKKGLGRAPSSRGVPHDSEGDFTCRKPGHAEAGIPAHGLQDSIRSPRTHPAVHWAAISMTSALSTRPWTHNSLIDSMCLRKVRRVQGRIEPGPAMRTTDAATIIPSNDVLPHQRIAGCPQLTIETQNLASASRSELGRGRAPSLCLGRSVS